MGILRHLQHWLNGQGPQLQTPEFVPETHAIRLWADTFPPVQVVLSLRQECKRNLSFSKPLVVLSIMFQGRHRG